jgi:two-component system, LytTR family, response regulator
VSETLMAVDVRVLVVDPDAKARKALAALVDAQPGFAVISDAADGAQAVERIRALAPDLVLIEVDLPGIGGLEVVVECSSGHLPAVIFTAADDHHAVEAFDVDAVDFVLKPVAEDRMVLALQRARWKLAGDAMLRAQSLRGPVATAPGPAPARFTVRVGDTVRCFHADDIDWVEADEYYVKLHIGGKSYLVRQTMNALEQRLPSDRFARIHRSAIVNVDRIVAMEPLFRGEFMVTLNDGTELRMSRRRSELLQQAFRPLN